MATLERHSYKKVDGEWQITKTMSLTYEKVPYTLSCLSQCLVKLEECLTPDLLTQSIEKRMKVIRCMVIVIIQLRRCIIC